jgi:hypothetical protein
MVFPGILNKNDDFRLSGEFNQVYLNKLFSVSLILSTILENILKNQNKFQVFINKALISLEKGRIH